MRALQIKRGWRFGLPGLIALAATLASAGSAWASSPSGVSVAFTDASGQPVASVHAGDSTRYDVSFTASTELSSTGNDSITVHAPAGTVFPGNAADYSITDNTNPQSYSVIVPPTVSDGGATVTTQLGGFSAQARLVARSLTAFGASDSTPLVISPGDSVTLHVGQPGSLVSNPTRASKSYTLSVATSRDTTPTASAAYSILPRAAARLVPAGGDGQAAEAGASFGDSLAVQLADRYGNAVAESGRAVTFTAPSSGPGAGFGNGATSQTDTESTDSSGIATSGPVVAGPSAGAYRVQATAPSLSPTSFSLTNRPARASKVTVGLAPASIRADGASTSTATATVTDRYGNRVTGDFVAFRTSGPERVGATTNHHDGTYTAPLVASATGGSTDTITATDASLSPSVSGTAILTQAQAPPLVQTGSATRIGQGSATLTGVVTPRGASTTYRFEYGSSAAYGHTTALASAGAGATGRSVSAVIGGLRPGATYHFRLVASNRAGQVRGPDRLFSTLPLPRAAIQTGRAALRGGAVRIRVLCRATRAQRCSGTLTLGYGHTRVGRSGYSLAGGRSALVRVKASRRTQQLVRRRRSLRVRALATVRGGPTVRRNVTIRR